MACKAVRVRKLAKPCDPEFPTHLVSLAKGIHLKVSLDSPKYLPFHPDPLLMTPSGLYLQSRLWPEEARKDLEKCILNVVMCAFEKKDLELIERMARGSVVVKATSAGRTGLEKIIEDEERKGKRNPSNGHSREGRLVLLKLKREGKKQIRPLGGNDSLIYVSRQVHDPSSCR